MKICVKLLLISCIVSINSLFAQDIIGKWSGSLSIQTFNLELSLTFSDVDGSLKAFLDIPAQGVSALEMDSCSFVEETAFFQHLQSGFSFSGKLKGNVISGTFKQSGYSFPLDFNRFVEKVVKDGFIKGRLLDKDSEEPLPFANIIIVNASDTNTMISGMATDDNGFFKFDNLPYGKYRLKMSAMGYHNYTSPEIELKKGDNRLDIGSFMMIASSQLLQDVQIIATRPVLEQSADRLIYNVAQSSTSVGDNALETLKKFPGVRIDQDENISLNGKSDIMVMIDDRPSRMSGQDLANLLKSMPSNSIDKIEAIDNPSAKYEAEGVGGILNIKTKHTRIMGYSGSVNLSGRYNGAWGTNESGSFNFRNNNVSAYISLSHGIFNRKQGVEMKQGFSNGEKWITAGEDNEKWNTKTSGYYLFGKAGLDYYINNKNVLALTYQASGHSFKNLQVMKTRLFQNDSIETPYSAYEQEGKVQYSMLNHNVALNYQHVFDSALNRQMFVDVSYVRNTQNLGGYDDYIIYNGDFQDIASDSKFSITKPFASNIFGAKVDYEHPFKNNKTRLEAGIKYSFVNNNSDLRYSVEDVLDSNRSNHYLYSEHIAAAYILVNHNFTSKTSLQVGLRGEYTYTLGNNLTIDSVHDNYYIMPFPSLNFNQMIGTKHGINLGYRYRLSRPRYSDLNPFVVQSSLFSQQQGNAYLKPEYSHSVTFTYSYNHMPIMKLNYDRSDGMIASLDFFDDITHIQTTMPQNLGSSDRLDITLMYQHLFFNRWQFMIYANADWSQSRFDYDSYKETKNSYSGMAYMSNEISILKWLSMEVNAWCMFPGQELYNKTRYMLSVDAGIKMSFFKKSFVVKISGSDLFNTASQWVQNSVYPDGNSNYVRAYWLSRGIGLSLSYNFSKGKVNLPKTARQSEFEESGRLGGGNSGQGQGQGGGAGGGIGVGQ